MAAAEPAYGSDENGLVWGYRFAPAAAALPVSLDQAAAWLAEPDLEERGEFLWLHFSVANSGTAPWLRQHLDLPDAFYESLRSEVGATRLEQDGDVLVALIHDVVFDFSFDASMVATTSLCITPRLLVSARLRPLRSADQLKSVVRTGQQFHSPIELLSHLLLAQASVLTDIVRRSTMRVNQVEDRLLARRASVSRAELGSLRRSLIRIQRLLAPEPAALFRLLNRPPRWISETDRQDLRQAAEEFASAVGDTLALAERVTVLQEELAALVSEQTSRTLFVLTLVTVLALPINLVAALFGMNVGGVPLAGHPYGFALVVVTLVASTGALALWVWRRRPD
jgi:zinc transporter